MVGRVELKHAADYVKHWMTMEIMKTRFDGVNKVVMKALGLT